MSPIERVEILQVNLPPKVKRTDAIQSFVTQEAARRATDQIKKREAELADEFKKKGLLIVQVNRQSFIDAILKSTTPESLGFTKSDYDRIVAIK